MLGFFHHWSMAWLFNSHAQLKENKSERKESERARKMFNRDCQLMALTWLLGRNKTAYIPTVSAVLRAVMYSAHPHESKCSPDQENMPLAVNSLQFDKSQAPPPSPPLTLFWITIGLAIVLLVPAPKSNHSDIFLCMKGSTGCLRGSSVPCWFSRFIRIVCIRVWVTWSYWTNMCKKRSFLFSVFSLCKFRTPSRYSFVHGASATRRNAIFDFTIISRASLQTM